jgi:hypothetical protein
MVGHMTWQLALSLGLLTGFIVGFASGYGIRAFIAFRRYYAVATGWFRDSAL